MNFNFSNLYYHYPVIAGLAINHYALLTVVWNIFLVLIPLALYFLLKRFRLKAQFFGWHRHLVAWLLLIVWLLFLPNAAYIITDIRHLLDYCPVGSPDNVCPQNAWMIMFFFVYGAFGWVAFYYLLKAMAELIKKIHNNFWSRLFTILTIPLVSLGVLLGLLNRYNSWEIFVFPLSLLKTVWLYFSQLNYFIDWFIFTIFLYFLYFAGEVIFKDNLKR